MNWVIFDQIMYHTVEILKVQIFENKTFYLYFQKLAKLTLWFSLLNINFRQYKKFL